ncbi:extracellular solute-binding protein [Actinomyces faecalis]|uniref:extracellular solute-binding protein n=1 Tax=Actinomyces faecalis TaxID=2722820 RepID=UPI0015530A10|nr:extracellular solute-binding protein [Actinomyces faecalis]
MGRIRQLAAALAVAVVPLSLTACSSLINPGASSAGSDSATLTVYSNSVSDGRGEWLKEQAEAAGFSIEYVDAGGGDVYNRIVAEKDAPVADVVFGLNDVFFNKLIEAGTLEQYTPAWADKVSDDVVDTRSFYYPIVKEPIMLVCDRDNLVDGQMPSDWSDLWTKDEFAGAYEVPAKLSGATVQIVMTSILMPYRDADGKLGISQQGWDAVSQWYANGRRAEEGTDLYAQMSQGNVACGQMWLAGKLSRDAEYGIVTDAARPSTGVPIVRQGVAIIKGAKNLDAAKKFADWLGSAEVQAAWSQQFGTAPTNVDALADGSKEAIDFTASFAEQDIDWDFVAKNLDAWVEEVQLNYIK